MKTKTKKSYSGAVKLTVLGVSLAGLAAGAYFFLGPKGKRHQSNLKAWAIKMKGDVIEQLETAREISEPVYHEIIDSVASEYKKRVKSGHEEIQELAEDLKKHWKTLSRGARAVKYNVAKKALRLLQKDK